MNRIAAAILAAGTSSRLGTPKQLLDLDGRPVLAHTLDAVRRAGLEPVLLVLGHQRDEIERQLDLSNLTVVDNPDYATGQSSSVRAALRDLPDAIDAIVFVLADQPLVEPSVIEALASARRESRAPIVQPQYAEGRGNPVLIGCELFGELREISGDMGARPVIERHREDIQLVNVTGFHRPDDIDTREDFERVQRQYMVRRNDEA